MPNLPFQLGNEYAVMAGVTAHTRTIFSNRMAAPKRAILVDVIGRARQALNHSLNRSLAAVGRLGLTPAAAPVINPIGNSFVDGFAAAFNFNGATNQHLIMALEQFRLTATLVSLGLNGNLQIVDLPVMTQGGAVAGYVRRYPNNVRGRIHLDFARLRAGQEWTVAITLVHEASHKFALAVDHAYAHEDALIAALTMNQLLENADSIAVFVVRSFQHNAM